MSALRAQTRAELRLHLRNGEQLLLTLGIPVLLLVFFSQVDVLPLPDGADGSPVEPIEFLAPGVLALAVLSTAFTGLAIATGFDRQYGVLKRLGATPLGRPRLLAAKTATVVVIELIQLAVLVPVALVLGWEPTIEPLPIVAAVVLATVAFAGVALLMAGTLPGLVVLAAANGIYVVLLLFGDLIIPLEELPGALRTVAELLPTAALAEVLRSGVDGGTGATSSWVVLAAWAIGAPVLAARLFRWE